MDFFGTSQSETSQNQTSQTPKPNNKPNNKPKVNNQTPKPNNKKVNNKSLKNKVVESVKQTQEELKKGATETKETLFGWFSSFIFPKKTETPSKPVEKQEEKPVQSGGRRKRKVRKSMKRKSRK